MSGENGEDGSEGAQKPAVASRWMSMGERKTKARIWKAVTWLVKNLWAKSEFREHSRKGMAFKIKRLAWAYICFSH